jgi:hypothetical protein
MIDQIEVHEAQRIDPLSDDTKNQDFAARFGLNSLASMKKLLFAASQFSHLQSAWRREKLPPNAVPNTH